MKVLSLLLPLVLLVSCGTDEPAPKPDPIVVYAPGNASSEFATLLAEFTEDTNVPVSIKWGSSTEITDAVINKTGIPADILITDNVADIWRAADEGALRPIESAELDDVSELVKDRDGYWMAINVFPARLATPESGDSHNSAAEMIANYEFCVLQSDDPLSRSYISNSIQSVGLKQTERGIRRMVTALENEPFENEADLLDAVRSGECPAAIVARSQPDSSIMLQTADLGAVTIDAVGVGRHSRYAESAQLFVDWLIQERPVEVPDSLTIPVSVAGYRDEEARLLAERAGYQ